MTAQGQEKVEMSNLAPPVPYTSYNDSFYSDGSDVGKFAVDSLLDQHMQPVCPQPLQSLEARATSLKNWFWKLVGQRKKCQMSLERMQSQCGSYSKQALQSYKTIWRIQRSSCNLRRGKNKIIFFLQLFWRNSVCIWNL